MTFLASTKTDTKPYKAREAISTTKVFPLWPPFLLAKRKVPRWSWVVYGLFFPDLGFHPHKLASMQLCECIILEKEKT